jgi:CubicO group peptidase (beta-lactamase class C family)
MQDPVRCFKHTLIALAGNLLAAGLLAAAPSQQSIDASIERALTTFNAPGMAVSVVHDGKVFYAAGHGLVEVGKAKRVDDRTLFQIGSVSKAFTTTALALLVDEGKLGWDDRVIDHLPEFRMYDPWVTREFTIRDLLTHRSGLPLGAGDLLMFPDGKTTPDEIIRALRFIPPASSFRSKFDYDNLLYIVAGQVVTRVAQIPFPDFLEQRVLKPLGMNDCVASAERAAPGAGVATPHMLVDGQLVTTTTHVPRLVAPAGGITCSARSMAKWMTFVLNEGATSDGKRLVSKEQFVQLTTPVTLLPAPDYLVEHAGAYLNTYALGWGVSTFYGQPMLSHGGGVWGVTTFIAVLPQQHLAVFASNNQMTAAPRAVVNDVIDQFLHGSVAGAGQDWIAILSEASQDRQKAADEVVAAAWNARNAQSSPSLPLGAYTGTYRDDWYGEVRISLTDDGKLWFQSARNEPLQGPLEHFQFDTFIARWTDRRLMADAYVTFSLNLAGKVDRIRMTAVSPATDFSYDFHDLDLRRVESP